MSTLTQPPHSKQRYHCEYHHCAKDYAHERSLRRHEKDDHVEPFPKGCPLCGRMIQSAEALLVHLDKVRRRTHRLDRPETSVEASKPSPKTPSGSNKIEAQVNRASPAKAPSNVPGTATQSDSQCSTSDENPGRYANGLDPMDWTQHDLSGEFDLSPFYSSFGYGAQN